MHETVNDTWKKKKEKTINDVIESKTRFKRLIIHKREREHILYIPINVPCPPG